MKKREKKPMSPKTKKILTAVGTITLSLMMLATVSYAWFVLTNNASIEGFQMKVGTTGALKIANTVGDDTTDFSKSISLTFDGVTPVLRPLTTIDTTEFFRPKYNTSGVVDGLLDPPLKDSNTDNKDKIETYCNKNDANGGMLIHKKFYLFADTEVEKQIGVKLVAKRTYKDAENKDVIAGTYVENEKKDETPTPDKTGPEALRISMKCANVEGKVTSNVIKYIEPHCDSHPLNTEKTAQYKHTEWNNSELAKTDNVIKMSSNNKFYNSYVDETNKGSEEERSNVLFYLWPKTCAEVDMYIWLEGSDVDCVNGVDGDNLKMAFEFTSEDIQ